jgi:hypothetical protein
MKRLTGMLCLITALALLCGWMLATPLAKSNVLDGMPAVADGTGPTPPPPWSITDGTLLADGTGPTPPPPWSKLNHARAA